MVSELESLIAERNVLAYKNSGVLIGKVKNQNEGFDLTSNILFTVVDKSSVLYLSGGRTPRDLYTRLAREECVKPGAVAMVDERFGPPLHADSNEKMIKETGFLRYLEMLDIPFYPILQPGKSREETAHEYGSKLRFLQSTFPKHIGILGIGADGHTAGLPAGGQKSSHKGTRFFEPSKVKSQKSDIYNTTDLVTEYNDTSGKYGERVTMTFMGLAMLDVLLVVVFGEEKKAALDFVFGEGSEEEVPGRFYKRPEIAQKTLLITDQER